MSSGLHFNDNSCAHIAIYCHKEGKYGYLCCPVCTELVILVSVGQFMVDQLVVGTTGRTALGVSLVKPEPHDSSVVFLTNAAHHPLVSNAWHNVRVRFGTSILLGLQHTVGILPLFKGLQGTPLQSSSLFVICRYSVRRPV